MLAELDRQDLAELVERDASIVPPMPGWDWRLMRALSSAKGAAGMEEIEERLAREWIDKWVDGLIAGYGPVAGAPEPLLPPYLLFLNRLFDELGAEQIEAMKITDLREEILHRWPSDQLGDPSKNLIWPMATILRSLEAKRGGPKRQGPTMH
jgi:hypothetical protein